MVLFLTAVLICSCIGMVVLLSVKHWELATGRVVFADARPRIGSFFHRFLSIVENHVPLLFRHIWRRIARTLWLYARDVAARAWLWTERTLERVLNLLRFGMVPQQESGGQASAFLREVSEYKKRLMRHPPKQLTH